MNQLDQGRPRRFSIKKLATTVAVFVALTAAGVAGVATLSGGHASAGDCSTNSIIKCGEPNRQSFIDAVKASPELQNIYAQFGLTSADYDRFVTSAQPGVAYASDNTIKVNGRTVATNVWSIGRNASSQGAGYRTVVVPNAGTYYGNYNDKAFSSPTATIPVDVLFDNKGAMQFAVMTSECANPATGDVVRPTYECRALNSTPVSGQADTYSFTTDASAANGATISKLVYNFGDGSAEVTTTNPSQAVTHTFKQSSTVTVSVYVSLPGGGTAVLTNCHKEITVIPPAVFTCTSLTATPGNTDEQGNTHYTFAAAASVQNATINNYVFSFGDSSQAQTIAGAQTTASTTHTYAPGSWSATVTVNATDLNGKQIQATAPACATSVTVKTPECKPGTPAGSAECFTYTCDAFNATQGDNRTITINSVKASSTNPAAKVTSVVVNWGDNNSDTYNSLDEAASKTHTYAATSNTTDNYNIVATVHFDASGTPESASGANCLKSVSFTTPAAPQAPTVLPSTGAGSVAGLFGATAVVATLVHRLFLARRLNGQR